MQTEAFGTLQDGRAATLYQLESGDGLTLWLTDYGASLVRLYVPDRNGTSANVLLGYNSVDGYERQKAYLGGTMGRYANRIGVGQFTIGDTTYQVAVNNGNNHLHGGFLGFDKVLWETEVLSDTGIAFHYTSPDGEEGYPGTLRATVRYEVTTPQTLLVTYTATTDAPTIVNLTNHAYFNLRGQGRGDILDHELMILADAVTPVDAGLIPTGELWNVEGTPFDFRSPTTVGARIENDDEQLLIGKGYDHNFVLRKFDSTAPELAATLYDPQSGRQLEMLTTHEGLQFYSGQYLNDELPGADGAVYQQHSGLALEPQNFPDAPNKPQFPSSLLYPDQTYERQVVYRFRLK